MAGVRGNTSWIAMGKQSAKGTPATAAKFLSPLSGTGRPVHNREFDNLVETDDRRDKGASYLKMRSSGGNPEQYVRDNSVDFILAAAFGAVADSGTMPNYSHAITPAAVPPYLTVWYMLGDLLWERYADVMVNEVTMRADAGGPMTISYGLIGLDYLRMTSAPTTEITGLTLENGAVYTYNDATVTLAGASTALVSSFEMTLNNNISLQQTDSALPYDLVPGTLEIGLSFDLIFESLSEYNRFNTGTTAGTAANDTVNTTTAIFSFDKGANNQVLFDAGSIAYEEFPVEQQPDGSPVVVSVRAESQRPAPGGNLATATVKNQRSTTF